LLTLVFGISLSLVAFTVVLGSEKHRIEDDFKHDATAQTSAVEEDIRAQMDVLHNIASLYQLSDFVGRDQFHAFVGHAFDEKPGIQALEWIPSVPAAERGVYESASRRQGYPQFQFMEQTPDGSLGPAGLRDEYFPVYFLDPYEGNEAAMGYDLASNPIRLEALNLARDTRRPVATGRITLVQEDEDLFGFLVF
jgi:CHASE1-domain containing sensor protein